MQATLNRNRGGWIYVKEEKQVTALAAKSSKEEKGTLGLAEGT